ncbi:MAG: PHP domain-containing protein [Bryobacterales bacterium]|nr:PHP domain-containing protein [Bryobacterales bacterium]
MIDLHTHTNASDGSSTQRELLDAAVRAGITLLAITDHDTFAGWDAAQHMAAHAGVTLIPGVELSTCLDAEAREMLPGFRGDVHVLAYFPDTEPPLSFREWVATLLNSRWERNRALLRKLEVRGIGISEEMLRDFGGPVAGRVHLARLLMKQGHVSSIDDAFRKYFGEAAQDYVARRCPPLSETLERVREAGGVTSLAHPIRFWGEHWEAAEQLCAWMRERGLAALEVWHSEQPGEYSVRLGNLALRHQLGQTGGSDFHGANKPAIRLGIGRGTEPLVPARKWRFRFAG